MKKFLLFLLFYLAVLQCSMAQTQAQLDAFKASSPLFQSKYYKANVWDVQRNPPYAKAGDLWELSGFDAPFDASSGSTINWGASNNRYLQFDLVKSATGNYTDDIMGSGNYFNIILKLYESNGTYVKDLCTFGSFMGFGDKGFLFEQDSHYGTFFANDSYLTGGSVTYTPTTGKLNQLSQLSNYKYSPQLITKPAASVTSFTYNGQQQGIAISTHSAYTITGTSSAIYVGAYTVTISLNDKVNKTWSDGTTNDVVINWNIAKGTYNMSTARWNYTTPFTWNGSPKTVSVTGLPAGVTVSSYTGNTATNAGTYTATAVLSYDIANYNKPNDIGGLSWTIKPLGIAKPTVNAISYTYNGSEQGIGIATSSTYKVTGNASAINAGTYTATIALNDKVNNSWSDGTTNDVIVSWSIAKATYDMSAAHWDYTAPFTWNGTPKTVSVTGLPAGVTVNSYTGSTATNAGTYSASALLSYDIANYNKPNDIEGLSWTIKPLGVAKPIVNATSFTYNGSEQGIGIATSSTYKVTGNASAINAGTYTATIALNDKVNNSWSDGTTNDVIVNWSIAKANYDMSAAHWDYTAPFTWNGSPITVSVTGLPAGVTVNSYTGNTATNAGIYNATALLSYDIANYNEPIIPELSWTINPLKVTKPSVNATSYTYNGSEQGIGISISSSYTVTGVASAVNTGTYTATIALNDKVNNSWSDGTTDDMVINWSITKATYDMSVAHWDYTAPFTWNGIQKTVSVTGLPAGVTVNNYTGNTATNAGTYTATALLSYDIANYNEPIIPELSWTINPLEVTKPSANTTSFTYNGSEQGIGIATSSSYTITGVASAINAGTYTATISLNDKLNSNWSDGTTDDVVINWSIVKATYDMSVAHWDYTAPFTWNGIQKTVSVTGLPAGVTVNNYTGNTATNAGIYNATALLSYDIANYNEPIIPELSWTINALEVTKPSANTTSFTYNGSEQGIGIATSSSYTVTGIASAINAGIYTATISLNDKANKSWNDGTKDDVVINWSIAKASYDMSAARWDYTEPFTCDGTQKAVSLTGLPSGVTVNNYTGNTATNAGSYTATALLDYDEDNYHAPVISSINWVIKTVYLNLSIIKLWDNVLAVSNGEKYDDIRNATFRWYKDGVLLQGSQQYISFDGFIPAGSYKVEIEVDGDVAVTLDYAVASTSVKAYPNPVQTGQSLTVEMGEIRPDNEQAEVLSISGYPVESSIERQASGYRISGLPQGTYLVRIFTPGQTTTTVKIAVK